MAGIATGIGDAGSGGGVSGGIPGGGSGSAGGGGDLFGELGDIANAAYESTGGSSGSEVPGGEEGGGPNLPHEGDSEFPGGEGPDANALGTNDQAQSQTTDPNAATGAGAGANAEPIPGWKLNADGQTYTVPSAELPRVQAALQYAEALGQYFSTPEEAQGAYSSASQMRQMQNDWQYGTPDAIRSVMNFLAGASHTDPAGRMAFQRSFGQMMSMAPDILRQTNPQAYSQFVGSMNNRAVEGLYMKAAHDAAQYGPQSDVAKQSLLDAQSVEWGFTGKYRETAPTVDPNAQRQAQFTQQQRDFEARQSAALRRDVGNFNNSYLEGPKLAKLDQMIAEKLSPIKSRYPEGVFNDTVAGIHREIVDTLAKQTDWYTEHRQAFDQLINDYRMTWAQGSPGNGLQPRINAYQQDYLNRAGRIAGPIIQKRLNAATTAVTSARKANANGTTRNNAGATQPRNGASSSNAPGNGQRQTGESRSQQADRELAALFSSMR